MIGDTTRRSRLRIDLPDLARLMNLPEDVEITAIQRLPGLDVIDIEVRGPGIKPVPVDQEPVRYPVEVRHSYDALDAHYDPAAVGEA